MTATREYRIVARPIGHGKHSMCRGYRLGLWIRGWRFYLEWHRWKP